MRRTRLVATAIAAGTILAACGGGSGGSGDGGGDITIGLLAPLTGGNAITGLEEKNALEIATKELNDAGGIDGRKVRLKSYDVGIAPEEAVEQAQKAITQDKVAALIGPTSTSSVIAVRAITDRSKVVLIANSAATPAVTEGSKYVFRTSPLSPDLAAGMISVVKALGNDNTALMYDSGGFGEDAKDVIAGQAKSASLSLTTSVKYDLNATDVSSEVSKVKQSNPGAVIIAGSNGADYGLIAKAMAEQGLDVPLLGFVPIVTQDALNIGGKAYNTLPGVYLVSTADTTNPLYKTLLDKYNASYDKVDNLSEYVLGAYDAFTWIADGLKESDGEGSTALAEAIRSLEPRQGVNGRSGSLQSFTDSQDALSGEYLVPYKLEDGKPVQDTNLKID